jgi:hypothetical protein
MAGSEKDRLGDKLRDAERGREDQYFAEQDRKLVEQLRRAKEEEAEASLKAVAHMRCPKCGARLVQGRMHGVSVEECPACHGVWLDQGELQELGRRETEGWIARWLRREFNEPE